MPILGSRGAGSAKGFGITSGVAKTYAASYLVIAGGGGGSGGSSFMLGGGGGGAGGYRNSYASETSGGGGSTETPLILTGKKTYTNIKKRQVGRVSPDQEVSRARKTTRIVITALARYQA